MTYNIDTMTKSELEAYGRKVNLSFLSIEEKCEIFKKISEREKTLDRTSAACENTEISIHELEDIL